MQQFFSPRLLPKGLWIWRNGDALPVETVLFSERSGKIREGRFLGRFRLAYPETDRFSIQPDALDEMLEGLELLGRCLVSHNVASIRFTALWPYRQNRKPGEVLPKFILENGMLKTPDLCFDTRQPAPNIPNGQMVRITVEWLPEDEFTAPVPKLDSRLPVPGTEDRALLRFE